jgi:dolichol-phosphate mannosyltransferase
MVTFFGVILYSIVKLLTHAAWPAGFATLAVLILGSISINAMLLGIIGEYLGRMYIQMKKGPLTIVESSIDAYADSTTPNVMTKKVH